MLDTQYKCPLSQFKCRILKKNNTLHDKGTITTNHFERNHKNITTVIFTSWCLGTHSLISALLVYISPHVESESCELLHQLYSVHPPLGQVPLQLNRLLKQELKSIIQYVQEQLCKGVTSDKTRLFAVLL